MCSYSPGTVTAAASVQLYSAECLEICIWHWTISSVKHVPGCNPLYLIPIVYCQKSSVFSFVEYNRHTICSLLLISCLLLKSHFLRHPFLGMIIGHPASEEEVSCLRLVFQWLWSLPYSVHKLYGDLFFLMVLQRRGHTLQYIKSGRHGGRARGFCLFWWWSDLSLICNITCVNAVVHWLKVFFDFVVPVAKSGWKQSFELPFHTRCSCVLA